MALIAIVEDETKLAEIIKNYPQQAGFSTLWINDSAQAVASIKQPHSKYGVCRAFRSKKYVKNCTITGQPMTGFSPFMAQVTAGKLCEQNQNPCKC